MKNKNKIMWSAGIEPNGKGKGDVCKVELDKETQTAHLIKTGSILDLTNLSSDAVLPGCVVATKVNDEWFITSEMILHAKIWGMNE